MLNRRQFLAVSVGIVLGSSMSSGCGTSYVPPTVFTVMSNSSDPLLVTMKSQTGEDIEVFGTRGVTTKVNDIFITDSKSQRFHFRFNESNQLSSMISPEGLSINIEWSDARHGVITASTPDGAYQLSTPLDMTKPLPVVTKSLNSKGTATRDGEIVFLPVKRSVLPLVSRAESVKQCIVHDTKCGIPYDNSDIYVNIIDANSSGSVISVIPAHNIGGGQYVASIPLGDLAEQNPSEMCGNIATALSAICVGLAAPGTAEHICAYINVALAAGTEGFSAIAAAAIQAACEGGAKALGIYCATLNTGALSGPEGVPAPTLASILCESPLVNRDFSNYKIYAWSNGIPYSVYSNSATITKDGAIPELFIEEGGETKIRSLRLNPSSPVHGQGYTGTSDVFCLPSGSVITMSIVGTDGYQNSRTYNISETQLDGSFKLFVPGAASGVKDVVTVKVSTPDGSTKNLTASLIFS